MDNDAAPKLRSSVGASALRFIDPSDFAEPGRSDKEGLRARIRAEAVTSLDRAYEEAQTARHAYALVRAAR